MVVDTWMPNQKPGGQPFRQLGQLKSRMTQGWPGCLLNEQVIHKNFNLQPSWCSSTVFLHRFFSSLSSAFRPSSASSTTAPSQPTAMTELSDERINQLLSEAESRLAKALSPLTEENGTAGLTTVTVDRDSNIESTCAPGNANDQPKQKLAVREVGPKTYLVSTASTLYLTFSCMMRSKSALLGDVVVRFVLDHTPRLHDHLCFHSYSDLSSDLPLTSDISSFRVGS